MRDNMVVYAADGSRSIKLAIVIEWIHLIDEARTIIILDSWN